MTAPDLEPAPDPLAAEWASLPAPGLGEGHRPVANARSASGGAEMHRREADLLALLQAKDVRYERLPMLEVAFDRLESLLTASMRGFTSENVEIGIESVGARRFGELVGAPTPPAMISVFRAVEWGGCGLLKVDSPLIYSIVDVLLGSRRHAAAARVEERPYTSIEITLIERLVRLILGDLGHAFAPVTPIEFRLERVETDPRFTGIVRPGSACVVLRMRVDLHGRGGGIELLLPYATLEPARDVLLQPFMGEKLGRDPIWERHLAHEVWHADVDLEAVLEERTATLAEVMRLKVGSVLKLGVQQEAPVLVRVGGVPMLNGHVARRGDTIVVKVDQRMSCKRGG